MSKRRAPGRGEDRAVEAHPREAREQDLVPAFDGLRYTFQPYRCSSRFHRLVSHHDSTSIKSGLTHELQGLATVCGFAEFSDGN